MELLALNDIARLTSIPAPTARRYASLFKEFLPGRRLGRAMRYDNAAIAVFERVAELYGQGRITSEIEEILRREFPRTIEVGPASEPIALPAVAQELPPQLGEALTAALTDALSTALAESIGHFTEALDKIAEQKTSLDSHQNDIGKLKNGFVLLARNLKRVAQRDQSEVRALMATVDDRVRKSESKVALMEEITLTLSSDVSDLKARVAAQDVEIRRLRDDRDRLENMLKRYAD